MRRSKLASGVGSPWGTEFIGSGEGSDRGGIELFAPKMRVRRSPLRLVPCSFGYPKGLFSPPYDGNRKSEKHIQAPRAGTEFQSARELHSYLLDSGPDSGKAEGSLPGGLTSPGRKSGALCRGWRICFATTHWHLPRHQRS